MEGYGEMLWSDGRKHIGYYKGNKKHGFGIYYWPDEYRIYVGFWTKGKQESVGKFVILNKRPKYGSWENGEKVSNFSREEDAIFQIQKSKSEYMKFFFMNFVLLKKYME